MSEQLITNLLQSLPLTILLVFGLLLMLADAFKLRGPLPVLAAVGLLAALGLSFPIDGLTPATRLTAYSNMLYVGGSAAYTQVFLCLSALLALFFVEDYLRRMQQDLGEVYALLLFAVIGMIMLANANDLIIVFVGLEIMSVCLYIMAALLKRSVRSNEAGLKYFMLGAFATGFLLYGIALMYGIMGNTQLNMMDYAVMAQHPFFYVAMGLLLVGFFFKIAAFPFHSWTPDVYTGTPTPLAGFMATGSKMAAFMALSQLFSSLVPVADHKLTTLIALLAVASMVYGNFVAARQSNIKRLLAYSSIAHTGYVLLGISAGPKGQVAVFFYMIIYMLMTTGAFGIISMLENEPEDNELARWKGLGIKKPLLGAAMAAFLFSLAGMPPLAGFMGKYNVFLTAIESGQWLAALIGILTSVVGAYYYLRVMVIMYFEKPEGEGADKLIVTRLGSIPASWAAPLAGTALLVVLLLVLGVFPSLVYDRLYAAYAADGFFATLP